MKFKDDDPVLGVPREAGADQIEKAFRRLARECHHVQIERLPARLARAGLG